MAEMCSRCEGTGYLCPTCGEPCSPDEGECDYCREEREEEEREEAENAD